MKFIRLDPEKCDEKDSQIHTLHEIMLESSYCALIRIDNVSMYLLLQGSAENS